MRHRLFTIHALLHDAAEKFGGRQAVFDGTTSLTFAQLHASAIQAAGALRQAGVRRGDRIGVCMTKSTVQAIAILGIALADAIIVPVMPKLKRENVIHIANDAGLRFLITDRERAGEMSDAVPDVPLLFGPDLLTGATEDVAGLAIGPDVAAIIYSSGSTGRPKGIMLTHRNIVDGARITSTYLGTNSGDRIGGVLSLDFDYGLNQLWQALFTGAPIFLHTLVFPADLFRFLSMERITTLALMPVIITRMFEPRLLRHRPEVDLSSVRYISSSGGPVSPKMLDQLTQTFPAAQIFVMYGLTEAFRSTYLDPAQLAHRPGSMGRPIPDVEVLVLDDDLREVAPGEPGELVHRGGCVAKGYWNAPAETAKRFRTLPQYPGETLVFSGDIVTRDEDGYLYFVGRRDAMIKTSGYRVSPTEVEEIAALFPGIHSCVATGIANADTDQDIVLVYSTSTPIDQDKFQQFLTERLPTYMVPRFLLEEESLPHTQVKIDRQAVIATVKARFGVT